MSDFEEVHPAKNVQETANPMSEQQQSALLRSESSSAKEVLASSQFLKRHVANVSYAPISIEKKIELETLNGGKRRTNPYNKTYFDEEVDKIASHLIHTTHLTSHHSSHLTSQTNRETRM